MKKFLGKKKFLAGDNAKTITGPAWELNPDLASPDYVDHDAASPPQITMNIALANLATTKHTSEKETDSLEIDATEAAQKLAPIAAKMGVEAGLGAMGIPPDALALAQAGMSYVAIETPGFGADDDDRARAILDAAKTVQYDLETKTSCSTKLAKPKVSAQVAAVRFERVLKADRHAAALASSRTVNVNDLQVSASCFFLVPHPNL